MQNGDFSWLFTEVSGIFRGYMIYLEDCGKIRWDTRTGACFWGLPEENYGSMIKYHTVMMATDSTKLVELSRNNKESLEAPNSQRISCLDSSLGRVAACGAGGRRFAPRPWHVCLGVHLEDGDDPGLLHKSVFLQFSCKFYSFSFSWDVRVNQWAFSSF